MIVGPVTTEVYRRIENYARKAAGAEASPRPTNNEAAAAQASSEQTTNLDDKGVASPSPLKAPSTAPEGTSVAATQASATSGNPENTSAARPNPWDALRVGSHVVGKYWLKDGTAYGWWIGVITGIDKNDFIIRWPDEPKTPPLKIERKHVAILHPAYDVTRERQRRR
jgi:hypothetical protein